MIQGSEPHKAKMKLCTGQISFFSKKYRITP